ncbi:hypothetical protein BOO91_11445 [Vibrio navarrensis]|uniref:ATP synthase subunit I n=1 Tax=Vibrio navarrensis TaxID=29495 RepID=UPI001868E750|nr:ATP synthase subunit I [Vibrio navarrensis]MBE3653590.1 hypothetical protein [Vibrio navarrensis]MBE3657216.1 hypothetical protein [Vibrio navarrensis]MBE3661539.1 hypothetical protein [Vibrio navarrensis]
MTLLNNLSWLLSNIVALIAGMGLGVIFFASLWWSVKRCTQSTTPLRWFISSFIARTVFVLAGFYLIGAGQLLKFGMCLLGFILARVIILRGNGSSIKLKTPIATRYKSARINARGKPPCA